MASSDFGRVSYTDAVEILKKNNDKFDYKVEWGTDLQTEHERYLTEQVYKKPVFVTDYPKEIKAFYMRLNDDGKTVAAADCLVPGIGEIIGGSQREERLDAAGEPHPGAGHEAGGLLVVLRPAALRFLPPRGLRPGLRAHGDVPHRRQQHPRRGAASPHGGKRGILSESQKSTHRVLFLSVRINIPRLGRGIFIYFVVLCAYANFRTSYKRIDGISYTIYPGEWIMSVEELSRYFRTRFRRQTLAALEGLQKKGLISFLVLGHGKLVKFKIRGWRRHNTILDYNAPCQKDTGFFFFPVSTATELVSAGHCSEMDAVLDLWLNTVYNDPQVLGSDVGPVVYLRNGTGCPLVSYAELASRWGISKATAGRYLKRMAERG